MATRASIEMDFRQAMTQAKKVDEIADRLSRVSDSQLNNIMQNLASGWKGENASAYLNKGFRLQNKISISSGELHNVASQIRRVAKQVYNAEMAALEIAMMRKY